MDETQNGTTPKYFLNMAAEINSLSRKYYMSNVEKIMFHYYVCN